MGAAAPETAVPVLSGIGTGRPELEPPIGGRTTAADVVVAEAATADVVAAGAGGAEDEGCETPPLEAELPPPTEGAVVVLEEATGGIPAVAEEVAALPGATEDTGAGDDGGDVVSFPVPAPPSNLPAKHLVISGTSTLATGIRERT